MQKRYFIHTFGCQMNEHDSARMGESLLRAGWVAAEAPERADLVLLNTCAIREKAEDKLYSALGRYRMLKAQRGARIGVAGCVAQQEKEGLLERAPYVDFVLGPDQIARIADLAEEGGVETGWVPSEEYVFPRADPDSARGKATAFVTAMKGCDNVCSFCVVPHTRGREVSRPYAEIAREVASLVEVGVREITLIGQNVNSYAGGCSFAQLIRRVAAVPGVRRIRFTTSHPMDLSPELVDCFRDVPQLMPHFHLPVQHGADTVLERMRRRYTIAEYEERVARLFTACPGVALTSDIICGFPGETEEEHALTLALLRRVPYDNLFSFAARSGWKSRAPSPPGAWRRSSACSRRGRWHGTGRVPAARSRSWWRARAPRPDSRESASAGRGRTGPSISPAPARSAIWSACASSAPAWSHWWEPSLR